MPKFKVLRRVDAWVDHVADVEAETAEQAVSIAVNNDENIDWLAVGNEEFWNARFVALDANGEELAPTAFIRG